MSDKQMVDLILSRYNTVHTKGKHVFLSAKEKGSAFGVIPLRSEDGVYLLQSVSFKERGKTVLDDRATKSVIEALSANALFGDGIGPVEVSIRTAKTQDGYVFDLGREEGQCVVVTKTGWSVVTHPDVYFVRPETSLELPIPEANGSLDPLWESINIPATHRELVTTWLIDSLRPDTPYPVLCLTGEQGTAKSTTQARLKALIDPQWGDLVTQVGKPEDVYLNANSAHLLSYNNLSKLTPTQQDIFCSISTGGAFKKRKLYGDLGQIVIDAARPVVLNGINNVITRPDLASRSICVELPVIEQREDMQTLDERFTDALPTILGGLFDAFSTALKNLDDAQARSGARLHDFERLGNAIYLDEGFDFSSRCAAMMDEQAQSAVDSSPVILRLVRYMENNDEFHGTYQELLTILRQTSCAGELDTDTTAFPNSPAGLSRAVKRAQPALRMMGINVEDAGRDSQGNLKRITKTKEVKQAA